MEQNEGRRKGFICFRTVKTKKKKRAKKKSRSKNIIDTTFHLENMEKRIEKGRWLRGPNEPLTFQNITQVCIQNPCEKVNMATLAASMRQMPFLNSITFSGLNLSVPQLNILLNAIPAQKLSNLCLSDVGLNFEHATALRSFMTSHLNLELLNLSQNRLDDKSMETIFGKSDDHSRLKQINLSGNIITTAGLRPLIVNLAHFPSLYVLDLSANDFGQKSLEPLITSCSASTSIRTINLSGCNLGDENVIALIHLAVIHCPSLSLDLSYNNLGEKFVAYICQLIIRRERLYHLIVRDAGLNDVFANALCNSLKAISVFSPPQCRCVFDFGSNPISPSLSRQVIAQSQTSMYDVDI